MAQQLHWCQELLLVLFLAYLSLFTSYLHERHIALQHESAIFHSYDITSEQHYNSSLSYFVHFNSSQCMVNIPDCLTHLPDYNKEVDHRTDSLVSQEKQRKKQDLSCQP